MDESLQRAVESGKIVEIGRSSFFKEYSFYFHHSHKEEAKRVISIFNNTYGRGVLPLVHEEQLVWDFVEKNIGKKEKFGFLKSVFNKKLEPFEQLIAGKITSINPFRCFQLKETSVIENALKKGLIEKSTVFQKLEIVTIAQKNRVADGKELFARMYENEKGYELSNNDKKWNTRIGQLLGYTANDIAWSNGEKYQNVIKLMVATMRLRAYARKMYLLENKNSPEL